MFYLKGENVGTPSLAAFMARISGLQKASLAVEMPADRRNCFKMECRPLRWLKLETARDGSKDHAEGMTHLCHLSRCRQTEHILCIKENVANALIVGR